jgi:hypothetical protein
MRLILDLSKHCIETELKRQHNRAVANYFRDSDKNRDQIELTIDMTQQALSTLDFGLLRAAHLQLAGGTHADVSLRRCRNRVDITIDDISVASFELKGSTGDC